MAELPRTRKTSMTRPHEIALFIDCACNRLRDESKKPDTAGTWQQKTNPMIKGAGSHALQESANRIVGRDAQITNGRYADSNATPPGWLNPINIKTTDIALSVDSKFRNDYGGTTSSDWSIDLPITLNKVTTMRVASLEMPMSYYGVSMAAGNSTFLAVSCGSKLAVRGDPSPGRADFGPAEGIQLLLETMFKNSTDAAYNVVGTAPDVGLYDLSDPSAPIKTGSLNSADVETLWNDNSSPAWLVILPDGNYEIGWQDLNSAEDIVKGMASAIQIAIPGKYYCETGHFRAFFTLPGWLRAISLVTGDPRNPKQSDRFYALLSTYLGYDVNRCDGKSIFANALSNESSLGKVEPGTNVIIDSPERDQNLYRQPFNLHFAVDRGGNRDLVGSLQHKLGWMLGYRVGSYYTKPSYVGPPIPGSGGGPSYFLNGYGCGRNGAYLPVLESQNIGEYTPGFGAMSYISESVCNMEGPKYLYLCVTDGTNNHGSSLIGCFAESTFNKDIMLRINLAASAYSVKIYRYFSLAGVASGWWRSRSYYGPVTIKRLRFRLFDEFGRTLDLNGLDWSMAMVFDQLYD